VNIATAVLATPTIVGTVIVFAVLSNQRKWWTLVPALLIPIFGGCTFVLFLFSGLST